MPVLSPRPIRVGGKTYYGKIIKPGNKWLRWAFVEAVAPAIATDRQLRAQYERLKFRGTNKARVAIARKLLMIAFQISRSCVTDAPRAAPRQQRGERIVNNITAVLMIG
jgi:transposase